MAKEMIVTVAKKAKNWPKGIEEHCFEVNADESLV